MIFVLDKKLDKKRLADISLQAELKVSQVLTAILIFKRFSFKMAI
jgi:hypothetical protein